MSETLARVPSFHKRRNTVETCFFVECSDELPSTAHSPCSLSADPRDAGRFSTARPHSHPSSNPGLQTLQCLLRRSERAAQTAPSQAFPPAWTGQRARFLDRFVELLRDFGHSEASLFRAVHILDGFAGRAARALDKRTFQLSSLVALRLAARLEEVRPVKLNAFLEAAVKNKFPKAELVQWELQVLAANGFALSAPTELELLLAAFDALELSDERLRHSALRLVRMSLFCADLRADLSTSELAAFALIYALRTSGGAQEDPSFDRAVQQIILAFQLESEGLVAKLGRFFAAVGSFHQNYPFLRSLASLTLDANPAN